MTIFPNRFDAFVLVSSIVIVLTLLCAWGVSSEYPTTVFFFSPPAIGLSAICLAAIGAVLGWYRQSPRRAIVLALLSLACLAAAMTLLLSADHDNIEGIERKFQVVGSHNFTTYWIHVGWYSLAAFFVAFLGVWGIRFLPGIVVSALKNRFQLTRGRALIAFAVGLFLVAFFNNLLSRSGLIHHDPRIAIWTMTNFWFSAFGIAFAFWMVVYVPSQILTKRSRWHHVLLLIGFLIIVVSFLNLDVVFSYIANRGFVPFEFMWPFFLALVGGVIWILALFGLADSSKSKQQLNSAESDEAQTKFTTPITNSASPPTVWSGIILLSFCSLILVPRFFDVSVLLEENYLENRWQSARDSAKVLRGSDGQIKLIASTNQFYLFSDLAYQCDFKSDVAPNVLDCVAASTTEASFEFVNMQPTVETLGIRSLDKNTWIRGGRVTGKQLGDICSNSLKVEIGRVEIATNEKGLLENFEQIVIRTDKGSVAKFLQSIQFPPHVKSHSYIQISSPISKTDWEAIVDASKHCKFVFDRNVGYLIDEPKMNCRNIVHDIADLKAVNEIHRLTVKNSNSKFDCEYWQYIEDDRIFWDMYFALPGRIVSARDNYKVYDAFDVETTAKERHWIFGFDERQNPTHMFVPAMDFIVSLEHFTEVTTLSLDERWVDILPADYFPDWNRKQHWGVFGLKDIDPTPIARMTKLENLALPSNCNFEDAKFLKPLASLKHLQIPGCYQFTSSLPTHASFESITFFGKPIPKTILGFQNMSNLKKLVVVDINEEETMDEKFIGDLKKSLPGIVVEVLDEHDFRPDIPQKFQQYIQTKSAELFDKVIDKDGR